MEAVQAIRAQVIQDIWDLLKNDETPTNVLILVCIDFLRSFDQKIFTHSRQQDYQARTKHNLRRRRLMQWTIEFLNTLKRNQTGQQQPVDVNLEQCYTLIARLLVN
jgi:hypothetical protein